MTKPKNKYFSILSLKKFGTLIEDDKYFHENEDFRGIGVCISLDEDENNLLIGDHLGLINIYSLNILNEFMNKKFENDEQVREFAFNKINIKSHLCIKAHTESIKYINIPKDLKPKIILSTGNDRNIKLFNYETGKYIDSLKQISIKNNPIPIAIEYIRNNPFLEDVQEIEKKSSMQLFETDNILKLYKNKDNFNQMNNKKIKEDLYELNEYPKPEVCTIYRNNIIKKSIKMPEFEPENTSNTNAFLISNDILEYNAKLKLYNTSLRTNIPQNKSTLWNYDIDINFILNKKKEDINELINQVKIKEKEIIETEIAHKTNNIYNPDYQPIFIKNLDEQEKEDLTEIINEKIKNIKFAISKSQISKCENENLKNLYNYNAFLSPKISKEKKIIKTNINNSVIKIKKIKKKNITKIQIDNENSNKNKNVNTQFSKTTNNGFVKKSNKNKNSERTTKSVENKEDTNYRTISSINSKKIKSNFISPMKTMTATENQKWHIKYNDRRIQRCLNQFSEKLFELQKPFELLYNNKNIRRNILPKINQNIFLNFNITK